MLEVTILNLYLPFLVGYALIWSAMIYVDSKREKKIENQDQYQDNNGWVRFVRGFLPTLILFITSFFIPLTNSVLIIIGLIIYLLGIIVYLFAIRYFLKSQSELNTLGLYKYSRNPMYLGGMFFILGLNLMGWSNEVINYLFLLLSIGWLITIHFHVLSEESFLLRKYGKSFQEYMKNTPRYIGKPKFYQ